MPEISTSESEDAGAKGKFVNAAEKPSSKTQGRPSAAACGFSTQHMTDREVLQGRPKEGRQDSRRPCATSRKSADSKRSRNLEKGSPQARPEESSDEETPRPRPPLNLGQNSSGASSSTSSGLTPPESAPRTKARAGEFKVRSEFPKTNIRRWMTPGSRDWDSLEPSRKAHVKHQKNMDLPVPAHRRRAKSQSASLRNYYESLDPRKP